ncbi:2-keto-4-pentenoate hydratase/2-oxohepta-3-ene-1,7-dioic acid hydratase in catechol pathway [Crossiella equi]|uniref:2-keto-4-pentenoate hydratase/2-oxohepta-3-ene-1,7-dioic acid hydratase in catechol pathway n=1 Tax=Crossiella equi TaxID=130796 RepID=A0ABS5A691_9PSEU|nr:fumarylacetoacetate hydrolase family protein [Crossiella equi]MBP2472123.1 2-keto-4-pentenoate hydratase/2-oxohepta-3-ene-1,7-dioic acid hydratase in catechol pathway [Crossiella equi]
MRFAAFEQDGRTRHGLVQGEAVLPLPEGSDLLDLLADRPQEADVLARTGAPVLLAGLRLLPPVRAASVRDFITFEDHVAGSYQGVGRGTVPPEWYEIPTFYFTNPHALIGAHDDVPVPPGSQAFDFELEVAAVIGRPGYNLSPAEAEDHIVGYTIFNDWSARDLQQHEMRVGLGPAKGKDTASTLGPYLVTPDELAPYRRGDRFDLAMTVWVNGTLIGTDSLANMAWGFADLLAYASRGTWLQPGDVLASGTCGNGCLVEFWGRRGEYTPPPLEVGDVVRMEVTGLGTIENTVVAGPPVHPVPPARRR